MHRTAAAASALAVAALLLAACEGGPSPRDRLEEAALATGAESSAGFALELTARRAGDTTGTGLTLTGEGAFDRGSRTGQLALDVPRMGVSMEVIFARDSIYAHLPAGVAGPDRLWVGAAKPDRAELDGAWAMDTTAVERFLDASEGEIRELGSAEVRGATVQGFEVTLNPSKLHDEDGSDDDGGDGSGTSEEVTFPVEFWLDAENRIRRMVVRIGTDPVASLARDAVSDSLPPDVRQRQAMGAAMLTSMADSLVLTLELFDFGTAVEPSVPDTVETTPLEELRERAQQGQAGGQRSSPPTGTGG